MLSDKTIKQLSLDINKNNISIEELVKECLLNVKKYQDKFHCLITVRDERQIIKEAREKDKNN